MIHATAEISMTARIAKGAQIWSFAQVRDHAVIEDQVSIGRGACVGVGVKVSRLSRIQDYALLYEATEIGEGVFIGPGAILTNDRVPRAVTPSMKAKTADDWDRVGVKVLDGASIGAGAVCVAPITVGRWSMVGAASLVTRDVPDYALVVGNPAKQVGWVGRFGMRLISSESMAMTWVCPVTDEVYSLNETGGIDLVESL